MSIFLILISILDFCKCNFPIKSHVRMLLGRSVIIFQGQGSLTFQRSCKSTWLFISLSYSAAKSRLVGTQRDKLLLVQT